MLPSKRVAMSSLGGENTFNWTCTLFFFFLHCKFAPTLTFNLLDWWQLSSIDWNWSSQSSWTILIKGFRRWTAVWCLLTCPGVAGMKVNRSPCTEKIKDKCCQWHSDVLHHLHLNRLIKEPLVCLWCCSFNERIHQCHDMSTFGTCKTFQMNFFF